MLKWTKWFGTGCRGDAAAAMAISLSTQEKLSETLEMFERRKLVFQEKISIENERFKSFTKFRNKKAAVECLKRKSFYESQLEQLEHLQSQIKDQIRAINGLT